MFLAVAVLALTVSACGSTDGRSSARVESVGPQTSETSNDSPSLDAFREAVADSPFLASIDWTPPGDQAALVSLMKGGVISGTIVDAEPGVPAHFALADSASNEENAKDAVVVGVDLVVDVDDAGPRGGAAARVGERVRVRLDLWTGQRSQVSLAKDLVAEVARLVPRGTRVVVPVVPGASTDGRVVPLLGTPFFEDPSTGSLVAVDPRLDDVVRAVPTTEAIQIFDPAA